MSTVSIVNFDNEKINKYLEIPIEKFCEFSNIPKGEFNLFNKILEKGNELKGKEIPVVAQNSDFHWKNIRILNNSLNIIDWEFSDTSTIPFIDIFNFTVLYGRKIAEKNSAKASLESFKELYFKDTWYSKLVSEYQDLYFSKMNIDDDFQDVLFLMYLIHRANLEYELMGETFFRDLIMWINEKKLII